MIEHNFDIPFISGLALREKQIQQNYRPVIAVHKWFARRPGTLFRGLLLSEFVSSPLSESYYKSNQLDRLTIADPFMGGGTPLLEANRLGCDVVGYDINPMAYWIVREELEYLDLRAYRRATARLQTELENKVGYLYRTFCLLCGSKVAHAKYFLWVKVQVCRGCKKDIDLFPGFLIAEDRRHPKNVLLCGICGALTECDERKNPGKCTACNNPLSLQGPARRNRCLCPHCGHFNSYPNPSLGPPRHRMFAIEYHCPNCKERHQGRFFKKPDDEDLAKIAEAESMLHNLEKRFVPDDHIPKGDETDRLHRWGYQRYSEMFHPRQLVGLELSCQLVHQEKNERVRKALSTNLSDLLRYQNLLCRYDTMALKSLDIFSVHGFPVGLVQCESNVLGIQDAKKGANIGSGGWSNIIDKYAKAKAYCNFPFEIRHQLKSKTRVPIPGEWIGEQRNGASSGAKRSIDLRCEDAAKANLPAESLDAVFTDPPYFGNVQYAELMDFCYVWLRRLLGVHQAPFHLPSTRNGAELTGNQNMNRGLEHFTEGLSATFQKMAKALKSGSPFVFTYHHNRLDAYYPIAVALLDSDLVCSASLPCPAEMGASIHINRTGSSIIDTVFVCRSKGSTAKHSVAASPEGVVGLVRHDIDQLKSGHVVASQGDTRCMIYGHLIRLAIWHLRSSWRKNAATSKRLELIAQFISKLGGIAAVEKYLVEPAPTMRASKPVAARRATV